MRWEYTTVEFVAAGFEDPRGNENYRNTLNQYGSEGWELVNAVSYQSPTAGADAVILFFRRPLVEPA
jgi:hypothetical protein